jgi:hypothetical protein
LSSAADVVAGSRAGRVREKGGLRAETRCTVTDGVEPGAVPDLEVEEGVVSPEEGERRTGLEKGLAVWWRGRVYCAHTHCELVMGG